MKLRPNSRNNNYKCSIISKTFTKDFARAAPDPFNRFPLLSPTYSSFSNRETTRLMLPATNTTSNSRSDSLARVPRWTKRILTLRTPPTITALHIRTLIKRSPRVFTPIRIQPSNFSLRASNKRPHHSARRTPTPTFKSFFYPDCFTSRLLF